MARKFKTLTKGQVAKLAKLQASRSAATDAVYDVERHGSNTPFSVCYETASTVKRVAYDKACSAITEFEWSMILQGRGWMDGRGHFNAY